MKKTFFMTLIALSISGMSCAQSDTENTAKKQETVQQEFVKERRAQAKMAKNLIEQKVLKDAKKQAKQLTELGFKHLVYTDIARDGMQTGIDVAAYRHVAEVAGFPVVASGGISTLDDIRALAAVGEDAIEGAITGRALYEGNFTLAQALAAARGEE